VFYGLRQNLGLKNMLGSPTKVGLRTLLVGAQFEYRTMFALVLRHFKKQDDDITANSNYLKKAYPDLNWNGILQKQEAPQFENPPMSNIMKPFEINPIHIYHSLANLGLTSGPKYIVQVIEALFAMLKNKDDLLKEFEAMVQSEQNELQDSQDVVSTDQTEEAAALALTKEYRAVMNRFWLEVIGGGEKKRLSYYLSNMLAFNVIPRILGQVLDSGSRDNGKYNKALKLAENIHQLPDFAELFGPDSVNAPNYFEFMLYATGQSLENREKLLRDAQSLGDVDVSFLYNCFEYLSKFSLVDGWKGIFTIQRPSNDLAWLEQNQARCQPLSMKYHRSLIFSVDAKVKLYYIDGEGISDLYEADTDDDDYFYFSDDDDFE
ncbi:hypothetical protein H4R34_003438, partial [Dimargaris verticillata]